MATKQTPTTKTRPAKKATKKRPRKASAKKKRTTQAPATSTRPTTPAKPGAKRAAGTTEIAREVEASRAPRSEVPVPVASPIGQEPAPGQAPSSRTPSYLESIPQDHAELVSGLFRVARGAAKDLKTLVTQAIAMSNRKHDRSER